MYLWRDWSERQRADAMEYRRQQRFPKHSPPHFSVDGHGRYLITAACYEHAHVIGASHERMTQFEAQLLEACAQHSSDVFSWCILPNHYHLLTRTDQIDRLRATLGKLHGRTSFNWNGEDNSRGRQIWHNCFERPMKSERHYFAALNYVLNNAVHHGYVEKWQEWPWSNAAMYLEQVGTAEAERIWREYPVLDFGKKWDVF